MTQATLSERRGPSLVNWKCACPAPGGSTMAVPSGEIVARPMVVRACGCLCEFQHFAVDKYRAQRLAKFQQTRCAECVAKHNEEQARIAAALPSKGEALRALPVGTQVSMTRRPDGAWVGSLSASGV